MRYADIAATGGLHYQETDMKNADMPAASLTKREQACIALRVPETGDPELDALIRTARKLDYAEAAMHGLMTNPEHVFAVPNAFEHALWAAKQADALLAALDASRPVEPKPQSTGGGE